MKVMCLFHLLPHFLSCLLQCCCLCPCFHFLLLFSSFGCCLHLLLCCCCSFRSLLISCHFSAPLFRTFNVTKSLSASAFSYRSFNLLRFQFNIFVFIKHAHWNVTVNVFETLSAPTFSLHPFVFLVFVCRCLSLTTRSHPFQSASDSHNSTAHSRCDEFF